MKIISFWFNNDFDEATFSVKIAGKLNRKWQNWKYCCTVEAE